MTVESAAPCGMDGGMVFRPGVPGLPPGASWTPTKSPRRKLGDSASHACPGAMLCRSEPPHHTPPCGMDGGMVFRPGVPGLPPGASWTPTKSPRRKPGDSASHACPGAMLCRSEPPHHTPPCGMEGGMVFRPGVPGLPPGASWTPTKSPRRKPGDTAVSDRRIRVNPRCGRRRCRGRPARSSVAAPRAAPAPHGAPAPPPDRPHRRAAGRTAACGH